MAPSSSRTVLGKLATSQLLGFCRNPIGNRQRDDSLAANQRFHLLLGGLLAFACGARTGMDADTASSSVNATTAAGGVQTTDATSLAGGNSAVALGGSGGTHGSADTSGGARPTGGSSALGTSSAGKETCVGSTVTIQVAPSPGSTQHWCLGKPGECPIQSISLNDLTHPLSISALCAFDCQTCQMNECHSLLCMAIAEVTAPVNLFVWDGTFYEYLPSPCNAGGSTCTTKRCAQPGFYSFAFYSFVNPAPGTADGCALAPRDTPVTQTISTFLYPSEPLIVMGL